MTDTVVLTSPLGAAVEVVLDGLVAESIRRYGANRPGGPRAEVDRYPAAVFMAPLGGFLLLRRDGLPIAGGAFMSHDDDTAELKRIWTHPGFRRQGLARRIVAALEDHAGALGYTRAYLTTGFRQPEAVALYRACGYRPLFEVDADPALYRALPFEKFIGRRAGEPSRSPVRPPAASPEEASALMARIKAEQEARILARLAARAPSVEAVPA